MRKLKDLSFKNKILFSTLLIMLLLSVGIALATRWVLVTNMTLELKLRGIAIAQSLADLSRTYILTKDKPNLVSLVFDAAQLGERKPLIAYIFILDKQKAVLAHTFTDVFPDELRQFNSIGPDQNHSVELLTVKNQHAYDIAVPVREGIYQIGTVHVGLNKKHIDQLIDKLKITFLGITSTIVIIFILIIHWLSRYITRPISQLTRVADEISRGNLDIELEFGPSLKDRLGTKGEAALQPSLDGRDTPTAPKGKVSHKAGVPSDLQVQPETSWESREYGKRGGDEVVQLAKSFGNMVNSINLYRNRLRESEEKYRSLFHSGPDPIFVLDRETLEILDANPSAEQAFGYTKDDLVGKVFAQLVPEQKEPLASHFESRAESGNDTCWLSQHTRARKKGDITFYVNVHACPTEYKGRDAVIVATNDITQIVEKDAQLIQASKMSALGEMSAGVAHELNQPLNAIKMGSEFLKMMIEKGERIQPEHLYQVVTEVSSQVDRASEIINCLREFGRKADLLEEQVDINKPIRGVLALLGQQLSLQNIDVKLDLGEALPPILAHNNRLQQVLFNLITNARDAINRKEEMKTPPTERTITIRSFQSESDVKVTVSDSGTGLPDSLKEKIFEPFFTTKEAGRGMGLGLSISYGIVQDYGGKIDVQTQEEVGTTFILTFPIYSSIKDEKRTS